MASPLLLTNARKGDIMPTEDRNGNLHSNSNGQFVEKGANDVGGADFDSSVKNGTKQGFDGTIHPGRGEKARFKIGLDFFADDIKKQSSEQVLKGIRNLRKRILEHYEKIEHPEQFLEWKDIPPQIQQGIIESWKREIQTFEGNIKKSEAELEERNNRDKH